MLQGTFCIASWRGIQVAVKKLAEEFFIDEEKVWVGLCGRFILLPLMNFFFLRTCDCFFTG